MSKIRNLMIATVAGAATAMAAQVASAQPNPPPSHLSVAERLAATGGFETLLAAATAAGWADRLAGVAPYDRTEYTVLAPTDEAFAELGATLDELLLPENRLLLHEVLAAHIFPAEYRYSDLESNWNRPMDFNMSFRQQHQELVIDETPIDIELPDMRASNGVIHVIDTVLTP
jgi:uncharacterized surface protein with fasciclin (FAS1) repeats